MDERPDDPFASRLWTRPMLERLGRDEHDFREFKSSAYVWRDGMIASELPHELSRQISAFANGGGGQLFLGVDDNGVVDEGVPVDIKGGGTRSWLEDLIPGLVDPPLRHFNVFEIGEDPAFEGRPATGRAVYVIDLPTSDDAPHMARDHRYYLRIAGKSRPMGHVHLQDIALRVRRPEVVVSRIAPYGEPELIDDPQGPLALVGLRALLTNRGRRMARHVGLELVVPRALVTREVRDRMLAAPNAHVTHRPTDFVFFRYHGLPLFPGQEVFAWQLWLAVHGSNAALLSGPQSIGWRVFADDAAHEGSFDVSGLSAVRRAAAKVDPARW